MKGAGRAGAAACGGGGGGCARGVPAGGAAWVLHKPLVKFKPLQLWPQRGTISANTKTNTILPSKTELHTRI